MGIPRIYGDCLGMPKPCLHFLCKWHVFTLIGREEERAIMKNEKSDYKIISKIFAGETCILDMAGEEESTLDKVGKIMRCTKENVRQLEVNGLRKLKLPHRKRLLAIGG